MLTSAWRWDWIECQRSVCKIHWQFTVDCRITQRLTRTKFIDYGWFIVTLYFIRCVLCRHQLFFASCWRNRFLDLLLAQFLSGSRMKMKTIDKQIFASNWWWSCQVGALGQRLDRITLEFKIRYNRRHIFTKQEFRTGHCMSSGPKENDKRFCLGCFVFSFVCLCVWLVVATATYKCKVDQGDADILRHAALSSGQKGPTFIKLDYSYSTRSGQ